MEILPNLWSLVFFFVSQSATPAGQRLDAIRCEICTASGKSNHLLYVHAWECQSGAERSGTEPPLDSCTRPKPPLRGPNKTKIKKKSIFFFCCKSVMNDEFCLLLTPSGRRLPKSVPWPRPFLPHTPPPPPLPCPFAMQLRPAQACKSLPTADTLTSEKLD